MRVLTRRRDFPETPGARVGCHRAADRDRAGLRLSSRDKMRALVLRLVGSGGFVKGTVTVYTEEMFTTASPTTPSFHLTSDQLTVVVASLSSLVFFVIFVVMLSIIYRKDPHCCKLCSFPRPREDMDAAPQYYSSRQMLVGSSCLEPPPFIDDSNTQRPGQVFYVGMPSSYSLPTLEAPLPRLPSYESVRKKDRQRQIHMMIADRFGLNGSIVTEPPPTYEESVCQSLELPHSILLDVTCPQTFLTTAEPTIHPDPANPASPNANNATLPV